MFGSRTLPAGPKQLSVILVIVRVPCRVAASRKNSDRAGTFSEGEHIRPLGFVDNHCQRLPERVAFAVNLLPIFSSLTVLSFL